MKTRFLFVVPFFLSNCHKISQDTKRDETKILKVKEKVKKNYNSAKDRFDQSEKIDSLNFTNDILTFGNNAFLNNVIFDFKIFYSENKRFFEFLCDCNSSFETELEIAKNKFKTLVEDFVNSDDDDKVVILGQLVFLFENLDVNFNEIFNDENLDKNVVTNVLNFVASVYCQQVYKSFFLTEVKYENSRLSSLNHDIAVAKYNGLEGKEKKIADIESLSLNDKKLVAVKNFSGNITLCQLFDNEDKNPHIFKNNIDDAPKSLVNLAANVEHFFQDPNFDFREKLIEILNSLNAGWIDKSKSDENVILLNCVCEICKKIAQKEHFNAPSFESLTSKLAKGIINSSDMWQVFIDACNTDIKTNEVKNVKSKDYSSHIVDLFVDKFVFPNDLAIKTFSLMPDQSLDSEKFIKLLNKIHEPDKIFASQEDSENFFRLLNFNSFEGKNDFDNFKKAVSEKSKYYSVFVNRTTFEGLIKKLQALNLWEGDSNKTIKGLFSVNKKCSSSTFVLQCSDEGKKEIEKQFGL